MLCGYLPFDDDPDNPDGDNINLLYKYILETDLDVPDYISEDARMLLQRMLVPDPKYRAKMPEVMGHRWLAPAAYIFEEEAKRYRVSSARNIFGFKKKKGQAILTFALPSLATHECSSCHLQHTAGITHAVQHR
jgi:serine/threonine protein kinase